MPSAAEVRPEKWTGLTVLFDNGEYSVISGFYEDDTRRALGERWNGNGSNPLGFPTGRGYPVWHVIPRFLEIAILHAADVAVRRQNVGERLAVARVGYPSRFGAESRFSPAI